MGGDTRYVADADTRAAIAARFALRGLDRLEARVTLTADGEEITVAGRISADVVQTCVATDAPVPASIADDFTVVAVPLSRLEAAEAEAEFELDDAALDTIGYTGAVDLADIIAESLALMLDPWPRAADADEQLRAAGVLSEDSVTHGAFAGLAQLRDNLANKGNG